MGRHSKPSTRSSTGPLVAVAIATSGTFAAVPLTSGVADAATVETRPVVVSDDGGWDSVSGAIESCESGGNIRARNRSSSASGAWQLIRGTWASVGGLLFAPSAGEASFEQQETAARRLYERDGLTPWEASRSCWRRKVGTAVRRAVPTFATASGGRHRTVVQPRRGYTIRRGDTLSAIAVANGHTWEDLFAENRAVLSNPNLLRVGISIDI